MSRPGFAGKLAEMETLELMTTNLASNPPKPIGRCC
jgi:hypothetical protein